MHNEANDSFVVCMHGLLYEIVYTELHGNIAQYMYVCILNSISVLLDCLNRHHLPPLLHAVSPP